MSKEQRRPGQPGAVGPSLMVYTADFPLKVRGHLAGSPGGVTSHVMGVSSHTGGCSNPPVIPMRPQNRDRRLSSELSIHSKCEYNTDQIHRARSHLYIHSGMHTNAGLARERRKGGHNANRHQVNSKRQAANGETETRETTMSIPKSNRQCTNKQTDAKTPPKPLSFSFLLLQQQDCRAHTAAAPTASAAPAAPYVPSPCPPLPGWLLREKGVIRERGPQEESTVHLAVAPAVAAATTAAVFLGNNSVDDGRRLALHKREGTRQEETALALSAKRETHKKIES